MWSGGRPILGFDADPVTNKLVTNHEEAQRVRAIFRLYAEYGSLLPVVQELSRRGWRNKRHTNRQGIAKGGAEFTRTSLWHLLSNPLLAGMVRHHKAVYPGEHEAIIDEVLYKRVQTIMERNSGNGGREVKNRHGSILRGLLQCTPCGCAMTPSYSCKNGRVKYRYYCCIAAQKKGWATCPSKSVPAGQMEQFVVERIKSIGSDPGLQQEVMEILGRHHEEEREALVAEERLLDREIKRWTQEARNLVGQIKADEVGTLVTGRLAEVQERLAQETPRLAHVRQELARQAEWAIPAETVARALERFDPLWQAMTMVERQKLLQLLIERIEYDGKQGSVTIIFRPSGLESLLTESLATKETAA